MFLIFYSYSSPILGGDFLMFTGVVRIKVNKIWTEMWSYWYFYLIINLFRVLELGAQLTGSLAR
jgi:hypothetical protein